MPLTQRARIALLCGALTAASSLFGGSYSLTDLGPLTDVSGRTDSQPNGINNLSQVAAVNAVNGSYRALLYDGSWTNLGTLGGTESLAFGVEDSGRVAGDSQTSSGETHAFLWTPGGTDGVVGNPQMKDLGTLGGATSEAAGVNKSGQVTGSSDTSRQPPAQRHAFIYGAGKLTDLGQSVSVLPNSFGYAINNSGHIAGVAYDANYTAPQAFFYDGNTAVAIGSSGGQASTALALNDGDHIAGYLTTSLYFDHAFHWAVGVLTDARTLGQGHYSYGIGINNSNVIVGGSFVDAADTVYHAFVWANGTMQDLNTLLDTSGTGWTLTEARAINDAGQIIGLGTYGGGKRAFLLNPVSLPIITEVRIAGADVILGFRTVKAATYAIQTSPTLSPETWTDAMTGIIGTGQIVTVTNLSGATLGRRFYRVKGSG